MRMRPLADLSSYGSALILKPSSLGDIVHTLPAAHALKKAHPALQLRWLANTEWVPLLEGNPDLTEVVPFPRRDFRGAKALPALFRWVRQWKTAHREQPEITLDFQGLARSALLAFTRGSRPVIGLSDSREGARMLHRHVVAVDPAAHSVDRYLALPRALGVEVEQSDIIFPLPAGQRPPRFDLAGNFLVLHPYSRGEGKSMSLEAMEALCKALAPRTIVVVGRSKKETPPQAANVHSLVNETSLAELLWLLRRASGVISVDSGPMHMASAVTDRTVGIHTWSNPRKVGPYNPRAFVWKAGRIAHRTSFSDAEVLSEQTFTPADAQTLAAFIQQAWTI